ncbi:hypothetical protein [Planktotalea sp.]|uniref:hypothetical protein n=1 Tax=Planktotalea sp. TaxID=2029877 RepID=UPI003F6C6F3F
MSTRIVLSLVVVWLTAFSSQLLAAPYADIIIDADKYEVLSEQNSETLLHPAAPRCLALQRLHIYNPRKQ